MIDIVILLGIEIKYNIFHKSQKKSLKIQEKSVQSLENI